MNKTLEFIFDFGSPNAYFSYQALPPMLERTGAQLEIIPCLLGGIFKATGNTPPMMAFGNVKNKMAYEQLEMKRFCIKHGITKFTFNSHFPVNTLMLMRGALVAQEEGFLSEYVEVGLRNLWEYDLKLDDPDIFSKSLNDAGFDSNRISKRMQQDDLKAKLAANTEQAVARGVFGVPTFFVGDDMFFGKDRLNQVEEALMS